ncbi:MAG TPA: glycosyltransferase family 87 protein [Gemmatimonadales bacterium]|nr:glycosyltransferase family 87 protein [Gemmatimonadales bacterium]
MLSARERRTLVALAVLYAAVVVPVGIRRGGDFVQELALSDRLVTGATPLYTHNPAKGVFWPPFAIAALVPFALVARASVALSQALWAVVNVVLLGWSLTRLAGRWGWRPVVLAVAAVAKPLQGNFEHQNLQVVLLALTVATVDDLEQGRERRAGLWVGLATAVKIFPGLLLVYLALRRRWRGCATGLATAAAATVGSMLRYGPGGAVAAVADWVVLSRAGQRAAGFGFQPLGSWVGGLGGSEVAIWLAMAAGGALVFATIAARGPTEEPLYEVGLVTVLAVLVSPIGWFYYHLLAIPAWVAALTLPVPETRWAARTWQGTLLVAGVLLSGMLTFDHIYPDALEIVKRYNYVWGAVLLLGALAAHRLVQFRRSPQPA